MPNNSTLLKSQKDDTFIGLIDKFGVVKSSSNGEFLLFFSFCAFSRNHELVQEKEIIVHQVIPNLDYAIEGLNPLSIVEISGEQILYQGQIRIKLSSVVKTNVKHPELDAILQKRTTTPTFISSYFGIFNFDRRSNSFGLETKWLNSNIGLNFYGTLDELKEIEHIAIQLFENKQEWDNRFRNKTSNDLLSLKNDSWLKENEPPLSEFEFQNKISLDKINLNKAGEIEVWYNDGNTFGGHPICIDGNLNKALNKAGIQQ